MLHDSSLLVSRRRGVILLVVVSMLTLFAIIGLSFVMYAESEAQGSKLNREAQVQFRPEVEPDLLAAFALGQFVTDVSDDETGVFSAMRGHSLARSIYGGNDTRGNIATNTPGGVNVVPFNGVGRLVTGIGTPASPDPQPWPPERHYNNFFPRRGGGLQGIDDHLLVNYMFHPGDGFLRDPERLGPLVSGSTHGWRSALPPAGGPDNRGPFTGGFNVPYTYPDLSSMYLAAVKADGTLLMPSFHRTWLFGRLDDIFNVPPGNPGNPNWVENSYGKYLTLRPRPVDQLMQADVTGAGLPWPLITENLNAAQLATLHNLIATLQARGRLFPYPEDATGDVKTLVGAPGGNDSIWMDLNFPPMKTPEGLKYKPLFAFHIQDLDNRINLNVHGNVRGRNAGQPEHRSNQGFGPSEVNVGKVLTGPNAATRREWANLFRGDTVRQWSGRYGLGAAAEPSANDLVASGYTPHFYSQVDFDSCNRTFGPTAGLGDPLGFTIPGRPGYPAGQLSPFPNYAVNAGWDNGADVPSGPGAFSERRNHPLLYNVLQTTGDDRRFAISNMEALLRYQDTGSPAMTSELFQLCPSNFWDTADRAGSLKRQRLVTVRNFDLDRPGVSPWVWEEDGSPSYPDGGHVASGATRAPHGSVIGFPSLNTRETLVPPTFPLREFNPTDWRWQPTVASALTKVDLNRKLTPYPLDQTGARATYSRRFDDADPAPLNVQRVQQFHKAREDRHRFANDIYERLLASVGLTRKPRNPNTPQLEEVRIRRWLAQLAVNIVDYIDEDDISTAFNFFTKDDMTGNYNLGETVPDHPDLPLYWVVGTELPRVVLNEVLVETRKHVYRDDPDPDEVVRVFAELMNPLVQPLGTDTPTVVQQDAQAVNLRMPLDVTTRGSLSEPNPDTKRGQYNIYKIELGTGLLHWWTPPDNSNWSDNTLGKMENPPRRETTDQDFTQSADSRVGTVMQPNTPQPAQLRPGQFMLLGPDGEDVRNSISAKSPPNTLWMQSERMKYTVSLLSGEANNDERRRGVTVALRRLANPHLPYEPQPFLGTRPDQVPNPWYNPYVTVDHIDQNPLRHTEAPPDPGAYASRGKQQPFASYFKEAPPRALGISIRNPLPNSPVMDSPLGAAADETYHTFGKPNHEGITPRDRSLIPLADHYHWLAHADRQLVNPLELVHVCGFAPHELTQRFITTYEVRGTAVNGQIISTGPGMQGDTGQLNPHFGGPFQVQVGQGVVVTDRTYGNPSEPLLVTAVDRIANTITVQGTIGARGNDFRILGQQPYNQRVRWFDENLAPTPPVSHRLYRFFEFATCSSRAAGVGPDARIPGRININTIWDPETLRALLDLPSDAASDAIFDRILMKPNPTAQEARYVRTQGPAAAPITANDRPFWGFGFGQYPANDPQFGKGSGIYDAFLRFRESEANGGEHPYEVFQPPTKILNNLTTRSNVFAVWVTVGFFEVTDDTARPVKLGAEIGKAENRHVRHRFFSIVDRTNLSVATGVRVTQTAIDPANPQPRYLLSGVLNGTFNGQPFNIKAGSTLLVDVGKNQEAVVVTATFANSISAVFTKPHEFGAPISLPDLPGEAPWFLKATRIEPANHPSDPNQYWVTVPATSGNNTFIQGEYDGLDWRIGTNTALILGSGSDQEFVRVRPAESGLPSVRFFNVGQDIPPNTTPVGKFRISLSNVPNTRLPKRLPPEPLTISNTLLGNPGPQPQFNPREAPFSAIVRYLSVIQ